METQGHTEYMSDEAMVTLVEELAKEVQAGKVSTTEAVKEGLKPLGSNVGPFGCTSAELEVAVHRLKVTCAEKGI